MFYGPYDNIEEACEQVPLAIRQKGLTVGILNDKGEVEEYWWKKNIQDVPVRKIDKLNLTIYPVGDSVISIDEGGIIDLRFGIDGMAGIQKGYLYQVIGQSEVLQQELTGIGKGDNNHAIVTNPSSAGVYKYRVKVMDSTGQFATSENETDYVEFEVRYGGLSISYNFTNLNSIQIKNIESVANQYFTATISVRDDSFEIDGVYISDGDSVNIDLPPYNTVTEPSDSYLGYKYYILPDTETLLPLNGKFCYIKVVYTEDGVQHTKNQELFTLLDRASLEIVSQSVDKDYYLNFPDYYTFQFKSGVANVSVYVSQGAGSDFTFDPVTITSYNNYSLRVIPNNVTNNAQLVLNCAYTVGGTQLTKVFTQTIGKINNLPEREYYNPPAGSVINREILVNATSEDFVDGARYYKIENDFVSDSIDTCAFIVDVECKINQTSDKTLKYIRIM